MPSRNILNREIGEKRILLKKNINVEISVIPWDDSSSKKAKDYVWRKLGGPVFLDSSNQVRDFPLFLGKELKFDYNTNWDYENNKLLSLRQLEFCIMPQLIHVDFWIKS